MGPRAPTLKSRCCTLGTALPSSRGGCGGADGRWLAGRLAGFPVGCLTSLVALALCLVRCIEAYRTSGRRNRHSCATEPRARGPQSATAADAARLCFRHDAAHGERRQ
eukprot:scaffold772_cov361-Prasinococcus_capsulatus_cf.AAC.2